MLLNSENAPELLLRPLDAGDALCDEVRELYEASFPVNERRPFSALFTDFGGRGELFAALEAETFIGMICLLSLEDITHILYFAVKPELRGRGYGSRILSLIRDRYRGQRIIADLERPQEGSPNKIQREKRIAFYRENGYLFTDVVYIWEDEDYLLMSSGGNVTMDEFRNFWRWFFPKK